MKKLISSVLFIYLGILGCANIPPQSLTITRMEILKARISSYFDSTGSLPILLSELPQIDGRDNKLSDGWGRKILYKGIDSATILLYSHGEDGVINGEGLGCDIKGIFRLTQKDSSDSHSIPKWDNDPYLEWKACSSKPPRTEVEGQ